MLQRPSISRVQAPASETSARQSSEYGLLLRPSFVCEGMAVERAARWATPASSIYAAAAGDEQADLGVAGVGFSELQSLEQQQRLPLFFAPGSVAGNRGGANVGHTHEEEDHLGRKFTMEETDGDDGVVDAVRASR